MHILLAIALSATAGLVWNLTTHNQTMTYWQMGGVYFSATILADAALWVLERRRTRIPRTASAGRHSKADVR